MGDIPVLLKIPIPIPPLNFSSFTKTNLWHYLCIYSVFNVNELCEIVIELNVNSSYMYVYVTFKIAIFIIYVWIWEKCVWGCPDDYVHDDGVIKHFLN